MPKPRKSKSLYPEPGLWVAEDTRGLPAITPPEPLPRGLIETADVVSYVSYEGLGYCVYDYIPAERLKDVRLRLLWSKARKAMQDVVEHLDRTSHRRTIRTDRERPSPAASSTVIGEELEEIVL